MVRETLQHELVRLLWPNKANNSIFAMLLRHEIDFQQNDIKLFTCSIGVSVDFMKALQCQKNTYEGNYLG